MNESRWPSLATGIQAIEAHHREIVSFDADASSPSD
jgi:hypothetical protein